MKILVTIIEWSIFFVLAGLVILIASSLLPTKDILSAYVVASGSMEPTIQTGAVVFTTKVNPKDIRTGEIVTFSEPTNPKNIIVHRVIAVNTKNNLAFKTKGDHNETADNWTVTPSEIKGKALFSIPYLGYVVSWLKTPSGFATGIGIPALILILLQAKKIKEGINDEVEKRTKEALLRKEVTERAKVSMIILSVLSFSIFLPAQKTFAAFTASATVTGISLQVDISQTPTPTPTLTPSPTPTQNNNGCDINISNTGGGSVNTVDCTSNSSTTINQSNQTTIINQTVIQTNTK